MCLRALAPHGHDVPRPKCGQMLGHDRLLEGEGALELLDGLLALREPLEDADARGWASARKKSLLSTCRGVGIYIDITIYRQIRAPRCISRCSRGSFAQLRRSRRSLAEAAHPRSLSRGDSRGSGAALSAGGQLAQRGRDLRSRQRAGLHVDSGDREAIARIVDDELPTDERGRRLEIAGAAQAGNVEPVEIRRRRSTCRIARRRGRPRAPRRRLTRGARPAPRRRRRQSPPGVRVARRATMSATRWLAAVRL